MTVDENEKLESIYYRCIFLAKSIKDIKEELLSIKDSISRLEKELISIPSDNTLVREYDEKK